MMKPLVVIVVCALGGVARASGVDDAVEAVREAQHASDDGAACKGLSTKLKLATEALAHASRAPTPGVVKQARGRVEVAKDFAATACPEAVKARVTTALAAALTALDKAAEPPKVVHQGAAFGAACRASDACASERCFVGAEGDGYCTKVCAEASECPAHWACRHAHSGAEKLCIK